MATREQRRSQWESARSLLSEDLLVSALLVHRPVAGFLEVGEYLRASIVQLLGELLLPPNILHAQRLLQGERRAGVADGVEEPPVLVLDAHTSRPLLHERIRRTQKDGTYAMGKSLAHDLEVINGHDVA
eukprot:scaffold442_cov268-Pinguiococcus_pyrenoidosus.AAC.79